MPILDSELEGASQFTLIPATLCNAHVTEVEIGVSREAKAPMATLTWEIDEGDFTGRKIKFDTIMLGGLTKDGKPQNLGNLCNFIYYTGYPWSCGHCGTEYSEKHSFHIATKEDKEAGTGLSVGQFCCANCKHPKPKIRHDTDLMKSQRCGVRIGSRKEQGSDREFNEIKAYTDLIP